MYTLKDILRFEVAPALGCTEPAAVALCTAAARSLLPEETIESIEVWLSPSIYKNAYAVAIPGTHGDNGIDLAASLGCFGGDPAGGLQVLDPINDRSLEQARAFMSAQKVVVHLLREKTGIYIRAQVKTATHQAQAVIEQTHNNLTRLEHNDRLLEDHPLLSSTSTDPNARRELETFLRDRTLEQLLVLIDDIDQEDQNFLLQGVQFNQKLARHGLAFGTGLGIGKALERLVREGLIKKDMILDARILTSAAADARMSGVKLPAMSSAGSGNHGLTAVLPIWAVKDHLRGLNEREVLKAVALSHVITAYIKAHTGRLSAVCGCSVAAGAGAAAGIAFLMGGHQIHIAGAIKNLISDLAGVICDGAKASCALKLGTAAGTAVQAAVFSLHGITVGEQDGIVAGTPEQTMKNMGQISSQGMIETDRTVLQIMIDKQFNNQTARGC
jgi:L-cysteine desulfidase